jgi:HK97 family phage major capsid protein
MQIEIKDADSLNKAVHDLREVVESKTAGLSETKSKIEKIEEQVGKFLDAEQEQKSKILAGEQKIQLLKEQIGELEAVVSRQGAQRFNGKAYKTSDEYKALVEYVRKEAAAFAPELKSFLRTDVDTAGGFLVPVEMSNELERNIVEYSPMRQICRIKRTNAKVYSQPLRQTNVTSSTPGEGQAGTRSRPVYQLFDIKVNKITVETAFTLEDLQDSAFDLEAQLNLDFMEEFRREEGYQFIKGESPTEAIGIMTDTNITSVASGIANDITFDNFMDLTNIKYGYDLTYAMNRATIIRTMKLKDNIGQYVWNRAVENEKFATINGHRYVMMIDMDDIEANAYPIICGDFKQGYTIVDRVGMYLIRDVYTEAAENIIVLYATRRVGGATTKPEAFLKLKVAVSV